MSDLDRAVGAIGYFAAGYQSTHRATVPEVQRAIADARAVSTPETVTGGHGVPGSDHAVSACGTGEPWSDSSRGRTCRSEVAAARADTPFSMAVQCRAHPVTQRTMALGLVRTAALAYFAAACRVA